MNNLGAINSFPQSMVVGVVGTSHENNDPGKIWHEASAQESLTPLDTGRIHLPAALIPCNLINDTLPSEILQEVFKKLRPTDLAKSSQVCRYWQALVNDDAIRRALRPHAFGAKEWGAYFGDVGIEPPLPLGIHRILNSPCPIWTDKKVEETHMLVLIPQSVNEAPMTLNLLGELVQNPLQGNESKFEKIYQPILDQHGNTPISESYWVLMTRDVIPGSRNKTYAEQKSLVDPHPGYTLPKVLEAAICIFMQNVSSGKHSYTREGTWTFTRCEEQYLTYPLVVGGFAPLPGGLYVLSTRGIDYDNNGVVGLRRF